MQLEMFDGTSGGGRVTDVALHEAARVRYLNYALSVITSRALPDVRDGLKPVQRRILYAMLHNLQLRPEGRYRKSAAVVGEVMAKYHPHGDTAIYDAMVRMAQDFSLRYPLVDGQGNFGSLDGDRAAAMRYTECKLRHLAMELLSELKRETVPMRPNYDGTLEEPVVLPAQVPNLLINGVTGIAVGMATNIPPHHLGEVIGALVHLIDAPEATNDDLCQFVRGPDFPTGGTLLTSPAEIKRIYETGEGAVRMRGEWITETIDKKPHVIITSIPYNVIKSDLISDIADHIAGGKVPQLVDIRDESTDDVRIVCELKKGADPEVAMVYLYKHTALQSAFHVNMTVLCPTDNPEVGAPAKLGLKEVLRHFLDFRYEVVVKRLEHELRELMARIHILEGFEKVFDALDEAIAIIRSSDDKADASERLRARFVLSEIQAEAILETRLHRLARMEILAIREELAEKRIEAARIQQLLDSPKRLWQLIQNELKSIGEAYKDERRTSITGAPEVKVFDPNAYIVDEPCSVIVTRDGWIKRQKSFTQVESIRIREGDEVGWIYETSTRKTLTFFTNLGSAYTLRVDDVLATTGYGEPVQKTFQFADGERIVGVLVHDPTHLPEPLPDPISTTPAEEDAEAPDEGENEELEGGIDPTAGPRAVAVTRGGKCLRFALGPFAEPSTRAGRKYARLQKKLKDDAVLAVYASAGDERVCLLTDESRALVFPAHAVKLLRGAGMGVTALKIQGEDRVTVFQLARTLDEGIQATTSRGREVVVCEREYKNGSRGGKGIQIMKVGSVTPKPVGPQVYRRPAEPRPEDGKTSDPADVQ